MRFKLILMLLIFTVSLLFSDNISFSVSYPSQINVYTDGNFMVVDTSRLATNENHSLSTFNHSLANDAIYNYYKTHKNQQHYDGPIVKVVSNGFLLTNNDIQSNTLSSSIPNGRITFDYANSEGFSADELSYIKDFIEGEGQFSVGIFDCIIKVFGNPFFDIRVKLRKADEPNSNYNISTQTITLKSSVCKPDDLVPKLETLTHEIIHAFSHLLIKPQSCFEEGITVAQTNLAGKLFCDYNNIQGLASELFNGIPKDIEYYDLRNQPAISPYKGQFWGQNQSVNVSLRYFMAGCAFWKLWRETVPTTINSSNTKTYGEGTFFHNFNKMFYSAFKDSIKESLFIPDQNYFNTFKQLLNNSIDPSNPNNGFSTVEGEDFNNWFSKQYIFNIDPDPGTQLLINYSYGNKHVPRLNNSPNETILDIESLYFFDRTPDGSEITLDGRLYVQITTTYSPVGQADVTNKVGYCLYTDGYQPDNWSAIIKPTNPIYNIKRDTDNVGAFDFSSLPKGSYTLNFEAITPRSDRKSKRILYFANKISTNGNKNVNLGVVLAPGRSGDTLKIDLINNGSVKTSDIDINNGIYFIAYTPSDKSIYKYSTNFDGQNIVKRLGCNLGQNQNYKNLDFGQYMGFTTLHEPTDLVQYTSSGERVEIGGTVSQNTIIINAQVLDDDVSIEIQLEVLDSTNKTFGNRVYASDKKYMKNQTGKVVIQAIPEGSYRWKIRTVRENLYSDWVEFGCTGDMSPDFIVGDISNFKIVINPCNTTLVAGNDYLIIAKLFYKGVEVQNANIEFSSSCGQIKDGIFTTPSIPSLCLITAKSGKIVATCEIKVEKISFVRISPKQDIVCTSGCKKFVATAYSEDGKEISFDKFQWSASPGGLGTITNNGFFCAGNIPGVANIKVSAGNITDDAVLSITTDPCCKVSNINILTSDFLICSGEKKLIATQCINDEGYPIPDIKISWTVLPPEIGSITNEGIFTANKPGIAEIVASCGSKSSRIKINVLSIKNIIIDPPQVTLTLGDKLTFKAFGIDDTGKKVEGVKFNWDVYPTGGISIDGNGSIVINGEPDQFYTIQASLCGVVGNSYVSVKSKDFNQSSIELLSPRTNNSIMKTGPVDIEVKLHNNNHVLVDGDKEIIQSSPNITYKINKTIQKGENNITFSIKNNSNQFLPIRYDLRIFGSPEKSFKFFVPKNKNDTNRIAILTSEGSSNKIMLRTIPELMNNTVYVGFRDLAEYLLNATVLYDSDTKKVTITLKRSNGYKQVLRLWINNTLFTLDVYDQNGMHINKSSGYLEHPPYIASKSYNSRPENYNRTMAPIRHIINILDGRVDYDELKREVVFCFIE